MIQLKKSIVLFLLVIQCFQANSQIVKTNSPMMNKVNEELLRFFIEHRSFSVLVH